MCGSDVTQATLQADWDNPLSGLVSFPHVMGHEIVARVATRRDRPSRRGSWWSTLARVAPAAPPCLARRRDAAPRSQQGEPIPGRRRERHHTGNIRGLPGGMGTRMVAHRSQLHRLPDGLRPRAGVLADPLAVGIHATDQALAGEPVAGDDLVVVLGAGTIGLGVAASLRRRRAGRVMVSAAWPYRPPWWRRWARRPSSTIPAAW